MTAQWDFVTSPLLKHCLIGVTSFGVSKSLYCRSVPFICINNFGYILQIFWIAEFTRTTSGHTTALFIYLSIHFHFLLVVSL
jgi:hypothetical protein